MVWGGASAASQTAPGFYVSCWDTTVLGVIAALCLDGKKSACLPPRPVSFSSGEGASLHTSPTPLVPASCLSHTSAGPSSPSLFLNSVPTDSFHCCQFNLLEAHLPYIIFLLKSCQSFSFYIQNAV